MVSFGSQQHHMAPFGTKNHLLQQTHLHWRYLAPIALKVASTKDNAQVVGISLFLSCFKYWASESCHRDRCCVCLLPIITVAPLLRCCSAIWKSYCVGFWPPKEYGFIGPHQRSRKCWNSRLHLLWISKSCPIRREDNGHCYLGFTWSLTGEGQNGYKALLCRIIGRGRAPQPYQIVHTWGSRTKTLFYVFYFILVFLIKKFS